MTDTITPASVNASWFAALKGKVWRTSVFDLREEVEYREGFRPAEPVLRIMINGDYGRSGYFDVPPDAKLGDSGWMAQCDSVDGLYGVGRTPAEAIADFNRKMVEP